MIAFYLRHFVAIPGVLFALALMGLALKPDFLDAVLAVCMAVWLIGALGIWLKS